VSAVTRAAGIEDVRGLWPAVSASHIFEDYGEFERWWRDAPWRVRVTQASEAAVLGRWRRDLDLLGVRGLWCPPHRVPVLIEDLREVAREQGFGRLLGPLVPEEVAAPYIRAGLSVNQRIVVYRRQSGAGTAVEPPTGVAIRCATSDDADAIQRLDAASFDEFWRYDDGHIADALASGRGAVAEGGGEVIGYTLCTLHGADATVGRLAVSPRHRRSGVGSALLADAIAFAAQRRAAAVTLCTQEENAASRGLYRRAGFREVPGRLVSTVSPPL
jgi:ribosomal protein S18 acetylase RimI-like enzyme